MPILFALNPLDDDVMEGSGRIDSGLSRYEGRLNHVGSVSTYKLIDVPQLLIKYEWSSEINEHIIR